LKRLINYRNNTEMFKRIDTHAHINFSAYDADRDVVIDRAIKDGTYMINVGTEYESSKSAVLLAEKYETGVYAIVGLHPVHSSSSVQDKLELISGGYAKELISEGEIFDDNKYKELLSHPKVVGIGECGLDYFRTSTNSRSKQKEVFSAQIVLANEMKKPMMLHIRESYEDVLDILKGHVKVAGNVHFFAGNVDEARKFLDLGFTLSFTGVITFSDDYDDLVRFVPIDMIQAETDSPYVTPVPYRGQRNEPLYVAEVIKTIAEIKNLPLYVVEEALLKNAKRVWGIPV